MLTIAKPLMIAYTGAMRSQRNPTHTLAVRIIKNT